LEARNKLINVVMGFAIFLGLGIGATTFNITTLSLTTFNITTLTKSEKCFSEINWFYPARLPHLSGVHTATD
jgi:hypothetical protein